MAALAKYSIITADLSIWWGMYLPTRMKEVNKH